MCENLDPQLQMGLFGSVDCGGQQDNKHEDCPHIVDTALSASYQYEKLPNSCDQLSEEKRTILWPDECLKFTQKMPRNLTKRTNFSHKIGSSSLLQFLVLIILINSWQMQPADACSARSTPKPRPPSQSAIRPNITFQTYACPPAYAAWYCLNGATCFTVKIADSILYNCECADGFMGQRCEFKDLDGSYLPTRERLIQLGNSPLGRAVILVVAAVISLTILSAIITKWRTNYKRNQSQNNNQDSFSNTTEERISGSVRYTIGTHHQQQNQSPFTISSTHCDVIRGYNLENSVIGELNSVHSFNPRQRAYNHFSM